MPYGSLFCVSVVVVVVVVVAHAYLQEHHVLSLLHSASIWLKNVNNYLLSQVAPAAGAMCESEHVCMGKTRDLFEPRQA